MEGKMMEKENNREIAKAMVEGYEKYVTRPQAVIAVSEIYPSLSRETLELMWESIDVVYERLSPKGTDTAGGG
uniref:Uncharacterized protein n=2 Tax=viral metagenome TaxID=1070528 RepID=A0A6M3K001_9ZZZZ